MWVDDDVLVDYRLGGPSSALFDSIAGAVRRRTAVVVVGAVSVCYTSGGWEPALAGLRALGIEAPDLTC
jgi:hypothetical protein